MPEIFQEQADGTSVPGVETQGGEQVEMRKRKHWGQRGKSVRIWFIFFDIVETIEMI